MKLYAEVPFTVPGMAGIIQKNKANSFIEPINKLALGAPSGIQNISVYQIFAYIGGGIGGDTTGI